MGVAVAMVVLIWLSGEDNIVTVIVSYVMVSW